MKEVWEKLAEEFPKEKVGYKVIQRSKDGKRGLMVPYVDARTVMERLDAVLGPDGWKDEYRVLSDHAVDGTRLVEVECQLSIRLNGEWLTKCDVGEGDTMKAAFSDALKRAAVKFGVGRYLYEQGRTWVERGMPITSPQEGSGDAAGPQPSNKGTITPKQKAMMVAIWKKVGQGDPLKDFVEAILGREVGSIDELTIQEASKVLDELKELERANE